MWKGQTRSYIGNGREREKESARYNEERGERERGEETAIQICNFRVFSSFKVNILMISVVPHSPASPTLSRTFDKRINSITRINNKWYGLYFAFLP